MKRIIPVAAAIASLGVCSAAFAAASTPRTKFDAHRTYRGYTSQHKAVTIEIGNGVGPGEQPGARPVPLVEVRTKLVM